MGSSSSSDSADNAREAAISGQYSQSTSTNFGAGDAAREQRIANQYSSPEGVAVGSGDASLGDPDPEVDVPTNERQDTITSFTKNLQANIAANPLMATPVGITTTAIQTAIANSMLGNISSVGNVDSMGGNGNADTRSLINTLTPYAPYAIRGEIAPPSMVNQYFDNLYGTTTFKF